MLRAFHSLATAAVTMGFICGFAAGSDVRYSGVWGEPPVKNNVSEAGSATGLWDAKQWSGSENHNHRSFKPTQSGCVFLLKNSKNRLFRLALGVTFSGLGCRQGRKRAPKGRQTIYPPAPPGSTGGPFFRRRRGQRLWAGSSPRRTLGLLTCLAHPLATASQLGFASGFPPKRVAFLRCICDSRH